MAISEKVKRAKKGGRNNAPLLCNDIMAGFNWPFVQRATPSSVQQLNSPLFTLVNIQMMEAWPFLPINRAGRDLLEKCYGVVG